MPLSARLLPLALVMALAACDGKAPRTTETGTGAVDTATSAPDTKPGLALSGGRLVLPAVKGNPAAIYFTLSNGSGKLVTLAAIDVAGAGMAMLHETMQMDGHSTMADLKDPAIPAGGTLVLEPGARHVMVDGVPAGWKAGDETEVTLTFADGDKLSAKVLMEAPGGAGAGAE